MKEIHFLMRALTHLNAAGVLALCGWLAMTAASREHDAGTQEPPALVENGCDCRFLGVAPGVRQRPALLAPAPGGARK